MATVITPETLDRVVSFLKANGFERALKNTSVDCIKAGIDADDFTYSVVSLFMTYILRGAMQSYSDPMLKASALQKNMSAIVGILAALGQELGRELGQEVADKVRQEGEENDNNPPSPIMHAPGKIPGVKDEKPNGEIH